MWHALLENLSKGQKIAAVMIIQTFIVVMLAFVLKTVLEKEPIRSYDVSRDDEVIKDIPAELADSFRRQLWSVASSVDNSLSQNELYYEVREGTYEETEDSDGAKGAVFIVDIDSLKQSFVVSIAWNDKDDTIPADILINCPPQDQMKYPETVCYGMYNNTYSLDLYLPYTEYPDNDGAPNYMISGNDADKTIDIMVSACDTEKFKKQAMDYLKSTPIKLDEYTINYEVNSVDIECE